jgi:hypothetical protein
VYGVFVRLETMEARRDMARKALRTSSVETKRRRVSFHGPLNVDRQVALGGRPGTAVR